MPKEEISLRDRFHRFSAEAWYVRAPAAFAVGGFAPRWCVDAFPQQPQPVHAKAGSRWPELLDVRYAVVSLLSSPGPDLIPA